MTTDAERMYLHTGNRALLWPAPGAPDGGFRFVVPAAPLRPFVERIGVGAEWVDPAHPLTERVLPDGGVHLLFNLGDPPAVPGTSAPACEALGPRCAPSVIRMAGRVEQVTVTLRPGGMAALLGIPAAELSGQDAPLDALWGPRAAQALERIAAAPLGAARVAAVEAVLAEAIAARVVPVDGVAAEAVRRIGASGGRIRVRALADGLGVGERRLEQLFQRHVGLSPKAACRIARFRATVDLLQREPHRPWSHVAYACGFYDQSHLVHEFQALAGLAPGAFRDRGCGFFQDASPAAE